MKNIIFVINSIGSGGAETALFNIIRSYQNKTEVNIHLVLLDNEEIKKTVPHNVTLHVLTSNRSLLRSIYQLCLIVRKLRPVIVVSFLVRANVANSFLRMLGISKKTIVCERMHLTSHLDSQYSGIRRVVSGLLPKMLYGFNDSVLGVSTGVTKDLIRNYGVKISKAKTIFNPYDLARLSTLALESIPVILPDEYIVNVGRLTKSKDHETLLRGFALSDTHLMLVIIGDGELQSALIQLAKDLGIAHKVKFLGYISNPYPIIERARFFISTSRNEGFPNVMLEAMALAVPVAFTTCESGPAEIAGMEYDYKASAMSACEYAILIPEKQPSIIPVVISYFEQDNHQQLYKAKSLARAQFFTLNKIAGEYWREIFHQINQR